MLDGLYAAAAGMNAQQHQLDNVANNLANVSTTGYHALRTAFSDLLYSQVDEAGTATTGGAGAASRDLGTVEVQGTLQQTGDPLDLAIEGPAFFELRRADGSTVLSRDGAFQLDSARRLVGADGSVLQPPITLPAGVSPEQVGIAADGTVAAQGRTLGKIALVQVPANNALLAAGNGQFTPTAASGAPVPASGASIVQGAVEGSNVDVGSEMSGMIDTERSYQMGSSAVKIEGEMMAIANQLRA
jgi:flagellar basal-body rod protein FlgG